MINIINIAQTQLPKINFAKSDVLSDPTHQQRRKTELQRAMWLCYLEHSPVNLIFATKEGMQLQLESFVWGVSDEYVLLQGGSYLPVKAITNVEA